VRRKVARKGRCPIDGKVTYRDEHSARRAMHNAQNHFDGRVPQRVYFCEDAKGWHLTSTDDISGLYAERARMERDEQH
jgi:hypothetical protein